VGHPTKRETLCSAHKRTGAGSYAEQQREQYERVGWLRQGTTTQARYPRLMPTCGLLRRGLTAIEETPICLLGMAMALRRFLTLCLAAALLVGATVQILPWNAAMAGTGHSDQMAGCAEHQAPPVKHMPNCIDHYGCLTVQALPTSPAMLAVPYQWMSVAYITGATPMLGLSIEPELSPPILVS